MLNETAKSSSSAKPKWGHDRSHERGENISFALQHNEKKISFVVIIGVNMVSCYKKSKVWELQALSY